MYLFEIVILFPLDIHPEVGLLGHMAVLFLTFSGTYMLFFIVAAPISIPTHSAQASFFSTPAPTLGISYLFDDSRSNSCEAISHYGFDFCFPDY